MSDSVGWSAADMPDLRGRHALVTGVTGGLGHHTALQLVRAGARVTLAARDESRLRDSAKAIADLAVEPPSGSEPGPPGPPGPVDTVRLDLADLSSVRRAAESVLDDTDRLDILVNNAGVMATPQRRTADGFELQLGTNHLGHFALTLLLMPVLADARVVTVTSLLHRTVRSVPLTDPREAQTPYNRWRAYGASKLANLQFTLELDRRARAAGLGLTSVAAHPGYAATHLQTTGPQLAGASLWARVMAAVTPVLGQSAAMGALPTLYAATYPGLAGGTMVGPSRFLGARGAPTMAGVAGPARDPAAAARLWQMSEEATGVTFSA
jgi:NAD(P)-dependent dehydrogenase (short-subunit alcohol dehydrogenase family)